MKKTKPHKNVLIIRNLVFAVLAVILIQGCGKSSTPTPTPTAVTPVTPVTPPVTPPAVVAETPTTANFDKLTAWNTFKANQSAAYNLVILGDSYTQGNFFTWQLRGKLLGNSYIDGGPGYCSFGRWDPKELYSIDSSIDPDELSFTYDPAKWVSESVNTVGPCDYVTNNAANSTIAVKSNVSLSSMTILYERHATSGDFRYRVNSGSWTTVSAVNAVQDIATVVVDVSAAGNAINLDIEPLKAGEVFCGVLGKRTGNVLTLDKVGSSGATADLFAHNDLWTASMKSLTPNGVIIMFGTNEMDSNVTPAQMKINLQNIITKIKDISPSSDIMLMCPPETLYEKETPRKYKIADYADMIYKLAVENNAAFINFPKVFGPFTQASVTSGLMDVDRIHPGEKGGELIATTIFFAFKK
jgi:lysophospholipase L1-like esterase